MKHFIVNKISIARSELYKIGITFILAYSIVFVYFLPGSLVCRPQTSFFSCIASNFFTSLFYFLVAPFVLVFNRVNYYAHLPQYDLRDEFILSVGWYVYLLAIFSFLYGAIYILLSWLPLTDTKRYINRFKELMRQHVFG